MLSRVLFSVKTVMIVGMGALGSRVARSLAASSSLVLVDFDIVQKDNLARTVVYTEDDVGKLKVNAFSEKFTVKPVGVPFTSDTTLDGIDCIVECSDNMHTKLLVNDCAKRANIPLVVGTASEHRGMAFTTNDACWQCIVVGKNPVDDCSTGIDPLTADAVAETQVSMVHAVLEGRPTKDLVLLYRQTLRSVSVHANPSCEACTGTYAFVDAPFDVRFCPGTRKLQARPSAPLKLDLASFENVEEKYASAVRVVLGSGSALVHEHGLVEFENVDEKMARAFVAHLI